MRFALSLVIALLSGSLAHAEVPLPVEVAQPGKSSPQIIRVQTVGGIVSDSLGTPTSTPCRSTCPPCRKNKSCCCK